MDFCIETNGANTCHYLKAHNFFLLAPVMRVFQILSCRQRTMKIANVATPELATRQLKKSQKKNREGLNELNFSIFFLRVFHLSRRHFRGGYTCNFLRVVATRQNLQKLHHWRAKKIAPVAAALRTFARKFFNIDFFLKLLPL